MLEFILDTWKSSPDGDAVVWRERVYNYRTLLKRFDDWKKRLPRLGVTPGAVVVLDADFSPNAVALFFALVDQRCVLVPLSTARAEFIQIAGAEIAISVGVNDEVATERLSAADDRPL